MKSLKTTYLALMTLILASCEIVLPSVPFSSIQDPTSNDTTSTSTTSETQSSVGESSTTSLTNSSNPSSSSQVIDPGYARQLNPTITIDGYRESSGNYGLPTTGDVKLLVIPVTFTDYRCGNLCATRKEQIRKTFFGTASETSWQSVKSFYEASSYGNLTLTGVVTDWFDSSWSTSQFAALTTNQGDYANAFDPTWAMLDAAIAWYKTYSGSNLTEYDTDFDGYIDSVYLVYNNPNATNAVYSAAGEKVFWAYAYWHY
ncbi:MAG: hypothetical protein FJ352_02870, partial [Firmicutes bacterium]|nr:hypothetical protein [Bacillota bacterium]